MIGVTGSERFHRAICPARTQSMARWGGNRCDRLGCDGSLQRLDLSPRVSADKPIRGSIKSRGLANPKSCSFG